MEEQIILTNKLNPHIDPSLSVWEWQIPVYLFLGGLTAGLLILGSIDVLKRDARPSSAQKLMALVTPLLGLGMFTLFLDLEHKLYVWRFYATFRITAPMSWGAWILLLVIPINLMLVAGTLRKTGPQFFERFTRRIERIRPILNFSERYRMRFAKISVALGIALGIYTGILLSAYVARPFWNTSILGLIFLVSGLSSGAALVQFFSRNREDVHFYARLDLGLIVVEILLIGLMVIGMISGPEQQRLGARLILGGELTVFFWVFVLLIGLLIPAVIEIAHLREREIPRFLAPMLVLAGGLIFRFFIVEAGQLTTWIPY